MALHCGQLPCTNYCKRPAAPVLRSLPSRQKGAGTGAKLAKPYSPILLVSAEGGDPHALGMLTLEQQKWRSTETNQKRRHVDSCNVSKYTSVF